MSTRATYTIIDTLYSGKERETHFYIHYDGYSEGAANYFYKLFACENGRGGLAEKFLRGNELAEFTENPANHGDREFHYVLKGDQLTQYSCDWDSEDLKQEFCGKVYDFVNKYHHFDEGETPLTYVSNEIMKRTEIKPISAFNDALINDLQWIADRPHQTGNASSCADRAFKNAALIQTAVDETSSAAPSIVNKYQHISFVTNTMGIVKEMYTSLFHLTDEEKKASAFEQIKSSVEQCLELAKTA